MATAREWRQRAAEFLQEEFPIPAGVDPSLRFSAFDPAQVQEAVEVAREFSRIATAGGDIDAIGDVLAAAREQAATRLPGLVKYALLIFLTHDPIGAQVGPPTLEERHPAEVQAMVETEASITTDDPDSLAFFREDVYANDHHAHWHQVYRADWQRQERQGEIFLSMHQQMLARYDAERLGVGRTEIAPLDLTSGIIEEGYDPQMANYAARGDGAQLRNAGALRAREEAFETAVADGFFEQAFAERRFRSRIRPQRATARADSMPNASMTMPMSSSMRSSATRLGSRPPRGRGLTSTVACASPMPARPSWSGSAARSSRRHSAGGRSPSSGRIASRSMSS